MTSCIPYDILRTKEVFRQKVPCEYLILSLTFSFSTPLAAEEVREKGLARLEGKDYVVEDGDIMLFRFNN